MKILVINGPNLNMLGIREPKHYGSESYADLQEKIKRFCAENGIGVEIKQSNHEGDLVDFIQSAYFDGTDGIVINPGAYTHTSVALLDAVKSVSLPCVEIHISDLASREEFRQISYIRAACIATVSGEGTNGYISAIKLLTNHIKENKK